MDDKEEVVTEQTEQEQPQQVESGSTSPRQSAADRLDNVASGMDMAGKTLETVGKGEERVANWMDGSQKAGNTAANVGSTASSAAEKSAGAAENIAKGKKAASEAAEKTAGAVKQAGAATEAAGRGTKAAGQGMEAAGKGTEAAGQGMKAIPYAGAAVGTAVSTVGKVEEGVGAGAKAAGQGMETAGKATKDTGKTAEAAAKAAKAEANAELEAAKAAKNAAAASKASNEAAKKATDKNFSDKLRERGKLNQIRGKRIQEQAKKFNSDEVFEKIGNKIGSAGKLLEGAAKIFDPKVFSVIFLLIITFGTLIVSYMLSPMFFMKTVKDNMLLVATDPDAVEKVNNFIAGLGFQDSKEAFYKEVDYLNIHYDKKLDFSYVMSALYYVDIYYGNNDAISDENDSNIVFKIIRQYLKDSNETIGEDGLTYSANKIYRLRDLATHQMLGDKTPNTMGLIDYIKKVSEKSTNEINNYAKCLPLLYLYAFHPLAAQAIASTSTKYKNFYTLLQLAEGTTNWEEIKLQAKNGKLSESLRSFGNMVEMIYDSFFNIKIKLTDKPLDIIKGILVPGIGVSSFEEGINKVFQVEYYEYEYNETEFENYLVDHYIREMPEFSKLIKDDDGNIDDEKVLQIAYEIRWARNVFADLYKTDESAKEDNKCIGNINLDLLAELNNPINLTDGQKIKFSGTNNFGLYKGKVHQGVDLEADSTGTKQGDNVYSLYDGVVVASTVDGTYDDKNAKGGWVVIEYTVQYSDSSMGDSKLAEAFKNRMSTILVYYGGLAPSSLTLKEENTVKKGQVIGKVGDASASETGTKPSLHFAIYDVGSRKYLNPINMFITCSGSKGATTTKMCGVTNEHKIWTFLLSKGYSKEAAAAIMGIWERESGLKPYMRQGYFGKESKTKKYTADVDSGKISRKKFINGGKDGYGLAQWTTANRKGALYDLFKKMGKSIGSVEVQMAFFEQEMNGSYKGVKKSLSKATTIEAAAEIFFKNYQGVRKSDFKKYNFDLRVNNAKRIYKDYKNYTCKQ